MKMLIESTDCWNVDDFKKEYKELFSKFKIEEEVVHLIYSNRERIVEIIEINTLDDLLRLQEECGEEIIIGKSDIYKEYNNSYFIEIYDGYRE